MDILGEVLEQGTGLGKTIVKQTAQAASQMVNQAWNQMLGVSDNADSQVKNINGQGEKQINRLRAQRNLAEEIENLRRRKQQARIAELQREARDKKIKKLQEIEIKKRQWKMSQADKSSQGTAESRILVG